VTDSQPANGAQAVPPIQEARPAFPLARLLYAIGFGIVAWFVFWILLLLGIVQFVMLALSSRVNEELRRFSVNLAQYLWELVAYILFVRDDQPFPIGPFPQRPA
jgi:uncharacterized membrane protein YeiB